MIVAERTILPRLSPALRLTIGDAAADLTPRGALRLAEELTRKAFHRVAEDAVAAVPLERKPRSRAAR